MRVFAWLKYTAGCTVLYWHQYGPYPWVQYSSMILRILSHTVQNTARAALRSFVLYSLFMYSQPPGGKLEHQFWITNFRNANGGTILHLKQVTANGSGNLAVLAGKSSIAANAGSGNLAYHCHQQSCCSCWQDYHYPRWLSVVQRTGASPLNHPKVPGR